MQEQSGASLPDHDGPGGSAGRQLLTLPMLLLLACLLLPQFGTLLLSWLLSLVPVSVFLVLLQQGAARGTIQVRNTCLMAAVPALLLGSWRGLLLGLSMIPAGYVLDRARRQHLSPVATGGQVGLVLMLGWLGYWTVHGLSVGSNPYTGLRQVFDMALLQGQQMYLQADGNMSAEQAEVLARTGQALRVMVPQVLPGLLLTSLLLTVWGNVQLAARLVTWLRPEAPGWIPSCQWRLPDQLIWLPITAAIMVLGPQALRMAGANLLLLAVVLYLFQGIAVMGHLLQRWGAGRTLRLLVWVVLLVQSLGLTALVLLGLTDTWVDFRRLRQPQDAMTGDV